MNKEELRIAICDDRREDVNRIITVLNNSFRQIDNSVRVCYSKFYDGEKLYEMSRKETYHLIFLDIEMPGLDGFELADRLYPHRPQTYLIFVSVHESFVFDSSEFMPLWFVRKSNLERDMFRAIRKYFQVTAYTRVNYRMREGFGYRNLPIKDILYIEGSGHNLIIQLIDGSRLEKYGSLKSMEEELAKSHFLRIHKNYLVNQEYIKEVGRREVYLKNKIILEMGRDRRTAIREAMQQFEKGYYGK